MTLINTETQYFQALNNIAELDRLINKANSYIEKLPTEQTEDIVKVQEFISACRRKRLGNFNLTKMYEVQYSDKKKNTNTYTVKIGDTLPYIAYIKYGRQDRWKHIYHENGLTTDQLVTDTDLIIPELIEPVDEFLCGADLFAADFTVLYVEKVLGEKL